MKKARVFLLLVFVAIGTPVFAGCSHSERPIEGYQSAPGKSLYDPSTLPSGPVGASIAYGHDIIVNTQKYLKGNVTSQMSCEACHLSGGMKARAGSLAGTYAHFPQWNARSKRVITLQDRLTECFLYSMNGKPPAYSSREMIAMVAYIAWLSRDVPVLSSPSPEQQAKVTLPAAPPNLAHGEQVYTQKCAVCHQVNGAGIHTAYTGPAGGTADGKDPGLYAGAGNYPPLWGPASFNNKAGMAHLSRMVPFVYYNMPASAPGTLSRQDAYDVAAYILSHPRPKFQGKRLVTSPPLPAKYF